MPYAQLAPGRVGRPIAEVQVGGVVVNRADYPAHLRTAPHVHPRGNLAIALSGRFLETWAGREHLCDAERVVLKPPGVLHSDRFDAGGVSCLNLDFEAEAWEELMGGGVKRAEVVCEPRLGQLARLLASELESEDAASELAREGLVLSLVAALRRGREGDRLRAGDRWLDAVRDRLHADFAARIRMDALAREAGVSPSVLARRFRARFGCSVRVYVARLRVAAALRALQGGEEPLASVALRTGFSDQSHMGRVLLRETGRTPGEWRHGLRPGPGRRRADSKPSESF